MLRTTLLSLVTLVVKVGIERKFRKERSAVREVAEGEAVAGMP